MDKSGFDGQAVERKGTGSCKWDDAPSLFGAEDILPMWVADMDFPAPQAVRDAVRRTAEHGVYGYPSARQEGAARSLTGWLSRRQGWNAQVEHVTLAPGVVPSLQAALDVLTEPGDGVLVQTPVYHPFLDIARSNGRVLIENPLRHVDGNWSMDLDGLETLAPKAKAMLLCSPHNPVGRVWTPEELAAVSAICSRHGVRVLSDEIHSDIVFRPHRHTPFPLVGGEAAERALVFVAPSKTFNIAGLNISAAVIPDPEARRAFEKRFRGLGVPRTNVAGLAAMEAAYDHGEGWLESLLSHLEGNARLLEAEVGARLHPLRNTRPEATYLAWIDCRELRLDDAGLAGFFSGKCRLGLNPGRMFGKPGSGWMRLNFATSKELVEEALDRMAQGLESI